MCFPRSVFMECLNPRFSFLSSPSTSRWRFGGEGGRWGYNPRHRKSQQHDNKSKCALSTLVSAYLTLRIEELRIHKNVRHFRASVACKLTGTTQWWSFCWHHVLMYMHIKPQSLEEIRKKNLFCIVVSNLFILLYTFCSPFPSTHSSRRLSIRFVTSYRSYS